MATPEQAAELRAKGFTVTAPYGEAKTAKAAPPDPFATNPTYGWDVYRPWHLKPAPCPGTCSGAVDSAGKPINLQTWYEDQRAANPDIVKKVVYGKSRYGQDLVAYKVSVNAHTLSDGAKPVVWYETTQHAREWLATEIGRRLFGYVLANRTDSATDIPALLRDTEMWFVPVVNVDGYDWTFQCKNTRLWRRNLRDNDNDNVLTGNDGVDTNRNWAEKWRYDQEGASDDFGSDTYRGPSAQSEPEVSSLDAMFAKLKPKFLLDYHTYGPLMLYPEGWQVETYSTDTPATQALAGYDDDHPAIADSDPDVSGELYTTNGDVTGHAYNRYGSLAYTVELTGGSGPAVGGTVDGPNSFLPGGFVYQDSEADVEDEFQRNLPFALDLARSANNPGRPKSHLGNVAPDFEPTTFKWGYGDPQLVEVNANRDLGPVEVHWRVNGGAEQFVAHRGVQGRRALRPARRLLPQAARQHHRLQEGRLGRGVVHRGRQEVGVVHVHVRGRQVRRRARDGGRGLHRQHEPVRRGPAARPGVPELLHDGAGGRGHLVRRLRRRRAQPHGAESDRRALALQERHLVHGRRPLRARAHAARRHRQLEADGRRGDRGPRLPQRRRLGARHRPAGAAGRLAPVALQPARGPVADDPWCKSNQTRARATRTTRSARRRTASSSPTTSSSTTWARGSASSRPPTTTSRRCRSRAPAGRSAPRRSRSTAATRPTTRCHAQTFVTTSSILPAQFPQFNSSRAIGFDRPPSYDPPEGTKYAYAESSDEGYQRLRRTIDLTGDTTGALKFKISYDTEQDYDYVFVEAHTVGQDDWTTLPDKNGHTDTNVEPARATSTGTRSTRSSTTTRPTRPRPRTARTPARPASGTPPPATPAASRTGRST